MSDDIKDKLKKAEWSDKDIWELVLWYDGLTKYWAEKCKEKYWKYGAEFDDLHQIGRIAMFFIIKRCKHRELLTAYIARSLPWKIKEAANEMCRRKGNVSLDMETNDQDDDSDNELKEALGIRDPEAEREVGRCEFDAMLRRVLPAEYLSLVEMLVDGEPRRDAGKRLGITRQAVEKQIQKIRRELENTELTLD